jgi:hypothetical protein
MIGWEYRISNIEYPTDKANSPLLRRPREPPRDRDGHARDGRQGQARRAAVRHHRDDRVHAGRCPQELALRSHIRPRAALAQPGQPPLPRRRHGQVLPPGRGGARAGEERPRQALDCVSFAEKIKKKYTRRLSLGHRSCT